MPDDTAPDDFATLRDRYTIHDRRTGQDLVTFDQNPAGLISVNLAMHGGRARLFLHGAHVTDFEPRTGGPVLFTSSRSHFAPGKAIRGGVPVIFPWFGPHPTRPDLPAHGFARTLPWKFGDVLFVSGDRVGVTLTLGSSDHTRRLWPHEFELKYTVVVGRALETSLEVHNAGPDPFAFEQALHTYLAVSDVRQVRVEGLDRSDYLDKVDGGRRKTQSGPITFAGETDRVYLDTPDDVTVHDPAAGRRIVVSKTHSATTVVWNPWVDKAKRMADFGDDEWPRMLCIETANAAENAVTLPPGERHMMRATVKVD